MLLGNLLYTRLTTDASVAAMVSQRVYPGHLPQSPTLPAVSYAIISRSPTASNTQLFETRIQLDCWAANYNAAQQLANLVQKSLRLYRQSDNAGNRILNIYDANQGVAYEDEQELWRVIVDMIALVFES